MSWKYYPKEFSSYEDYVKYLKEKGLALEAPEECINLNNKIMDYEKKYKESLERAKSWAKGEHPECFSEAQKAVDFIFPELKESEDERIRKELLDYLNERRVVERLTDTRVKEEWIAWLKKQGEQNPKHFELKAGHWYICHRAYCCRADHLTVKEGERFMCEEDGVVKGFVIKEPEKYFKEVCAPESIEIEQKPTDELKPKFKVGDWVVQGCNILKIRCVGDEYYCFETVGGYVGEMLVSEVDSLYHLWTIQDSKDGDVLVTSFEEDYMIVMYHSMCTIDTINAHCCLDNKNFICENLGIFDVKDVKPATKEQRDLLFQGMKEAGYEWNSEKKELKKI